ncbi:hypothetical protein ACGFZL_30730 [Streptomyces sp. NPDC048182]|uniref:hypothetical protein n=1 Tax=Streptomyces sp. NPDC048182 TaxID=3365507 RepID=UPI0037113EFD
MSLGDDQTSGGYGETRTRLPDPPGDPRRPPRSSSRSLITVVGVVVLLIAAIAFANRGDDEDSPSKPTTADKPSSTSTSPTGTRPVSSGYAHDDQGAQSAAANYAVALGSAEMFDKGKRDDLVQGIADSGAVNRLQSGFDADYSVDFLKKIGLTESGAAPAGVTFVSRTLPAGTKVTSFTDSAATVEVWCNGLFGLTGEKSTTPVSNSWFTVTMTLAWNGGGWKVRETSQKAGPTPVPGDSPVSGSDEMGKAVQEFGGFTYAR